MAGELDEKEAVGDGDECGDAEGNRQMPEEPRVKLRIDVGKRDEEDGNAKKPGASGNQRDPPGKMNDAAAERGEFFGIEGSTAFDLTERRPQRIDKPQPAIDAHRVTDAVVNNDRANEARSEERRVGKESRYRRS